VIWHIYAYLSAKHNARIVFDPTYPDIDESQFVKHDWTSMYGDVKEEIPPNMPEPRGREVETRMYVDADHATDKVTRRSRSGHLIYLNRAPIVWYSKRQATLEAGVFGAEFVSMKQGVEAVRALRYKLRMMGVPVTEPTFVYGDNMSVIHNTTKPESTLKKKNISICYHFVREAVAMGEILIAHIPSTENPADCFTKVLPGGRKREYLMEKLLPDLYAEHSEPPLE